MLAFINPANTGAYRKSDELEARKPEPGPGPAQVLLKPYLLHNVVLTSVSCTHLSFLGIFILLTTCFTCFDTQLAPVGVYSYYRHYYHIPQPWIYSFFNYALKMSCLTILYYKKSLHCWEKELRSVSPEYRPNASYYYFLILLFSFENIAAYACKYLWV